MVVLATHRLNAVRACADLIYVIENGTVTAGSHDERMAGDNWYRTAFTLQQKSFATTEAAT